MSIQGDIEAAIAGQVGLSIAGMQTSTGPTTVPRVEGSSRFAAIRQTTRLGTRLEFGQTFWIENYALTLFWAAKTIPRATIQAEWETFTTSLATVAQIGDEGAIPTIEQAYLSATQWGEAHEGHFVTMSATVTVERVE